MKRFLTLLALIPAIAFCYPKPQGYVNDYAGVLSNRVVLEHRISEYHKKTTVEIAVVTIDSLGGVDIESYAHGLFHTWGIGTKGKDNGLLILIAVRDHKTRIEVGYGLEGKLNDSFCGRVIRDDMIPQFKQSNFGAGVNRGLDTILQRLGE